MHDRIFDAFLCRQHGDAMALARESDFVEIATHGMPPDRFLIHFSCRGLVRNASGDIDEASSFVVGITFPAGYLRWFNPSHVVTWLGPNDVWHPNIAPDKHLICLGRMTPGTGITDLIYQCFEIITWNRVTTREDDALNWAACQWARNNPTRFPVDRRPLKRRPLELQVRDVSTGSADASI